MKKHIHDLFFIEKIRDNRPGMAYAETIYLFHCKTCGDIIKKFEMDKHEKHWWQW